ncbi:hypothetical protein DFR50_10368 [Roseiarcus fermentans]|uniref:Uncharacterized protein n=1 Tax=Roseiarcus fermentans TaxID=1473586 RepID=A0A366FR67_9HYPH|nr:hypothetical protein [Roseiarcus fermentans]RBP17183.1 hypothetical protein DFR50_10368 [Roseiarcus fermentans]
MIDPVHAAAWAGAGRLALDLMRTASALMPRGRDSEAIGRSLDEAGRALELASAAMARDLGYPLCRCVFPPKPMLWDNARGAFVCRESGCGRAAPGG